MTNVLARAVLAESRRYHEQAAKLLSDLDLIHMLKQYGEVKIVGSCAAGLMMIGDVDIQVVGGPYDHPMIVEIFSKLFSLAYFDQFLMLDIEYVKRMSATFPAGYYIGPRKTIDGEKWSFDIWFFTKEEEAKQHNEGTLLISEECIDAGQRVLILRTKKLAKKRGLSASKDIYRAVLRERVTTLHELEKRLGW